MISKQHPLTLFSSYTSLFCFTNFVPFSVAAAPLGVLALFSRQFKHVFRAVFPLTLFVGYCLVSVMIYNFSSLLEFEFFRRDGNLFVTFLYFVAAIAFLPSRHGKKLARMVVLIACASVFVAAIFVDLNQGNFHGLFYAHNAAGGFYAAMAVLAYFCFGGKLRWALVLFFALTTLMTGSRGSILALLGIAGMMTFKLPLRARWYLLGGLVTISVLLGGVFNSRYGDYTIRYFGIEFSAEGSGARELSQRYSEFVLGNSYNVFIRVGILWPKAVRMFEADPIFGRGFSSFNDVIAPSQRWSLWDPPVTAINNSGHAHHTYLHVAAETGLVGLMLLMWGMFRLDATLWREGSELGRAASMLVMLLLLMSITEHRLPSPSNAVPVFLVAALALAEASARSKRLAVLPKWLSGLRDSRRTALGNI